jgi:formylglycine-generating enzyme required for sulfatase activity
VGDRDYGKRLGFINKAIAWSSGATMYESETLDPKEYENLFGAEAGRARKILRLVKFSSAMTEGDLDGFILRNIFFEQEEKRRREEEAKRRAEEEEAKQRAEEEAKRRAEEEAKRRAEEEAKRRAEEKAYWDNYFIEIPAGKFVMGSDKSGDDERPQHTVEIPYTYKIARYPVTNADFAKFVNATKYKTTAEEKGFGRAYVSGKGWEDVIGANWAHPSGPESTIDQIQDHPVVQVSWHDAIAYCEWLTKDLAGFQNPRGLVVRLPTEPEWEKAARGEYGKEYPWGDEFDKTKCNTSESGIGTTTPVGKFSPQGDSPYGVADMSGNVWEWCQSKYKPYPYKADDGREDLSGEDSRVLRGGSFNYNQRNARGASRYNSRPHDRCHYLGFRVVVSSIS